jgi:hypothetical protein
MAFEFTGNGKAAPRPRASARRRLTPAALDFAELLVLGDEAVFVRAARLEGAAGGGEEALGAGFEHGRAGDAEEHGEVGGRAHHPNRDTRRLVVRAHLSGG